jgi:hypothetical protein
MKKPEYIEFINNILGIPNVISPEKQTRRLFTQLPKYIGKGGKNKRTTRKYRSVRKTIKKSKHK